MASSKLVAAGLQHSQLSARYEARTSSKTHMVTSMSGSWLMLSAASNEFSTSSRTVVYRHLPGCKAWQCRFQAPAQTGWHSKENFGVDASQAHVVKAGDVLVLRKEFCRALVLEGVCFHSLLSHTRRAVSALYLRGLHRKTTPHTWWLAMPCRRQGGHRCSWLDVCKFEAQRNRRGGRDLVARTRWMMPRKQMSQVIVPLNRIATKSD